MNGCSDADKSGFQAWSKKHKVELYSGGKLIGTWTTTGKIETESGNGYYFEDFQTHKIVQITGDVIITVND